MIGIGLALLAFLLLIGLVAGVARANEVFLLSARHGRCLLVRGALAAGLQAELCSLLRSQRAHGVVLRGVRRAGVTALIVQGADAALAQRLRNAFTACGGGRAPLLQSRARGRNVGQRLGIVWLSWWLA